MSTLGSSLSNFSPIIPGIGISVNITRLIPFTIARSTLFISKLCQFEGSL